MRSKPTVGTGKPKNRSKCHFKITIQPAYSDGFDGPFTCPVRRTTGIRQRPVTLVHTTRKETKTTPTNEIAARSASTKATKPNQVFWPKRLEGLRPVIIRPGQSIDDATVEAVPLEGTVKPVGPLSDEVAMIALISHLNHTSSRIPVIGQTGSRKLLETNPGAFVNSQQPLIQPIIVSDQDIAIQEQRVIDARTRLKLAMQHFG